MTAMAKTASILFAHGARDPGWAAPLWRVRAQMLARSPGLRVELAFFGFIEPTLADCVAALIADGFERVVIVPMFIAQGGHLKKDLPLIVDDLRLRYPRVVFEVAGPVGEAEGVIQAMAVQAMASLG